MSAEGEHGRLDVRRGAVAAISPVTAGLPGPTTLRTREIVCVPSTIAAMEINALSIFHRCVTSVIKPAATSGANKIIQTIYILL